MNNWMIDKWATLQFWWAKRRLRDGKDFDLEVDDLGILVTILRGKYKGVQFRYANLFLGTEKLDFNTVVVYNPEGALVYEAGFEKLSTNILRVLIADSVSEKTTLTPNNETVWDYDPAAKAYAQEMVDYDKVMNENGNTDTVELDQERDFHEESTPLLEKRVSKRKPRKKVVPADSGVHPEIQQPAKPKRARARTTGKKRPNGK
jgi:hypothetical protein